MPAENADSLIERVRLSSQKLNAVSTRLNVSSDAMTHAIDALEATLKHINLGIDCWVQDRDGRVDEKEKYYEITVGYGRIRSKWGIIVRQIMDDDGEFKPERGDREWFFRDAPRKVRIIALAHIPELVDTLISEADEVATAIETNIAATRTLAHALQSPAANKPAPEDLP